MNILIFDDHTIITDSLTNKLKLSNLFENVIVANTKEDTLAILNSENIDFIISDVLTDEEIGLSLFEKYQLLNIPIIAFTAIKSEIILSNLKELGVNRCVNKKEGIDVLIETIKEVLEENINIENQPISLPKLSSKEKKIVELLSKGMLPKEIAELTNTTVNTVNNQKNNLLEKFRVSNSIELISYLLKSGYIQI